MQKRNAAAYRLDFVQHQMRADRYVIPMRVRRYMRRQGWVEEVLVGSVCSLESRDLHKSQSHASRPGVWLDVYRPRMGGRRMYLKVTLHENGEDVLILTFCRDGEAH